MYDWVGSDKTLQLMERAMNVASVRHSLVASNIANVDTPGYKAHDIAFKRELKIALEQTVERDVLPGSSGVFKYETMLKPRIFEVTDVTPRQDGNTVDIDKELGKLAQTSGFFSKAASIYGMKLKMIKSALRD